MSILSENAPRVPQQLPLARWGNMLISLVVPLMTDPIPPVRLPLTQLKRGDRAVVASSDLSDEDRAVLKAMGLDERCAFTVCRASKNGPCIIQLDATRLGLSPELAQRILTRPCDCPDTDRCAQEPPKQ